MIQPIACCIIEYHSVVSSRTIPWYIDITLYGSLNVIKCRVHSYIHTRHKYMFVMSKYYNTIIPLPIVYSRSQFLRLCWYQLAGNSLFWARSPWLFRHYWKLALVGISSFSSSKLCSEAACRINEDESHKTFFRKLEP